MRFAYADPPYLGCGQKHYGHQHDAAADWDRVEAHRALLIELRDAFPDGWAVSLHTPSLEEYAHLCRDVLGPNRIRWGAWTKPFASFKPGVNPAFCWEPVAFYGGRDAKARGGREVETTKDFVSANITLKKGTSGAKPEPFSLWVLEMLGAQPDDELVDLFPGSGAVSRAWREWQWHNGAAQEGR